MMIIWNETPEGYLECFVNSCYGVVGIAPQQTGWTGYIDGVHGRRVAPILFHTAAEAKAWVEQHLAGQCHDICLIWTSSRLREASGTQGWYHPLTTSIRRALTTYQQGIKIYLDPQQYGQQPFCWASAQSPTHLA